MARVFITGSADGLGLLAANALIAQGHQVVLHARNEKRGQDALDRAPGAEDVVTGDLGRAFNCSGNVAAPSKVCFVVQGLGNPR